MLARTAVLGLALGLALMPCAILATTMPLGVNFEVARDNSDGVGGRPAIAFDGTNFLLVWLDTSGTIRGARIATDGSVLDDGGFAIGSGDGRPSVGFSGVDFLVIWVASGEVYGARVASDGTVAGGPWVITTGGDAMVRDTSLAFDGTNYLVAWRTNSSRIRAARVAASGTIVDGPAGVELGIGFYPWVAFDGTNYLVVWYYWGNGLDIFGNRVTTDGSVLDGTGFTITGAAGDQEHPSVAFGGGVYLVSWFDSRGGSDTSYNDADARAARVASDGTVLDTTALIVADRVRDSVPVNVAFDGTDFLVVWHVDLSPADFRLTDVYGRRVSPAGAILDDQAIPVSTSFGHQFGPRIGYGGGRYLVAWTDRFRCNSCLWAQMLEKGEGSAAESADASDDVAPLVSEAATNESVNWMGEPQPTNADLQDVLGFDGDDVYAVGNGSGPLFHWNGASWASISYPAPSGGFGLWGMAPDDLWITGWCYHVSHYSGGSVNNPSCLNVSEPGLGLGILRLPSGALLTVGSPADAKYYDGPIDWWPRQDWVKLPLPREVDLHDIWKTPDHHVYAVGEFGTVVEWDGAAWNLVPDVPTVQSLNATWGRPDGSLVVVGDFGEILHYDGVDWTKQVSGTTEHLFGVSGFGDTQTWAVGLGGVVLHDDGGGWSAENSGTDRMLLAVTRAGDKMLAVGDGGVFLSRGITPYATLADLAVTKDDGVDEAVPGESTMYTISVVNETVGSGLVAAALEDLPPSELSCTWSCTPTGGASCDLGPWDGALQEQIEIPEAATAVYLADCDIDLGAAGALANTATVATVGATVDPDPTDNTTTDTDTLLELGACGKPDHRVLINRVIDSPTEVAACRTISLGPALEVAGSGQLDLRAGRQIILRDGAIVMAGGQLSAEIDDSLDQ